MQVSRTRITSFILSSIFLVASTVVYSSFIKPSYESLMTSRGELEAKRAFFETEKTYIEEAQSLLAQYRDEHGFQERIAYMLPSNPDTSGAVAQISGIADLTETNLMSVASRVLEIRPSGSDIIKGVGVVELSVRVAGTYESIKEFTDYIATNMRIMNVKNATISRPGIGLDVRLDARFTIHTYYQAQ